MATSRHALALASGITASAATLGVLVGLGRASTDALFALAAGGQLWLGSPVRVGWPYVAVGIVRHLLLVTPLGYAVSATPATRAHLVWVALGVAAAFVVLGPFLPNVMRPFALALSPLEQGAMWLALAAGLIVGARLAPEGMP